MTYTKPDFPNSRWFSFYVITLALLSWFALALQLALVILQAQNNGTGAIAGVWLYFAFYTILTNLLVACTLTLPMLAARSRAGDFSSRASVITAIAANIILVGLAYNLLLRNTWNPQGLNLLCDMLLHDVVPIAFVGYWWMTAARSVIAYRCIGRWTIYPIVYFAYALIRGAANGFYPYPFLDVARLGYAEVVLIALGVLAGFMVIAALLIFIARVRAGHSEQSG